WRLVRKGGIRSSAGICQSRPFRRIGLPIRDCAGRSAIFSTMSGAAFALKWRHSSNSHHFARTLNPTDDAAGTRRCRRVAGGGVFFISVAEAYAHGGVALAYPLMRGVAPMLTLVSSRLLPGEASPPLAWIGTAVICDACGWRPGSVHGC